MITLFYARIHFFKHCDCMQLILWYDTLSSLQRTDAVSGKW